MLQAASQGEWRDAALHNPLMFGVVLGSPIVALYWQLERRGVVRRRRITRTTVYVAVAALLGNWVYLLLRQGG